MIKTQERAMTDVAARPQTFASILVHVEPGKQSSRRVRAAAELSRAHGARLIGLGAELLDTGWTADAYMTYAAGNLLQLLREQVVADLASAEANFRREAASVDLEWRSVEDFPGVALARAARLADLIVMSPNGGGSLSANPGEVVLTAGRPVLIVPDERETLSATSVVVAWKDCREARRAIADALPFLSRAEQVIVHASCAKDHFDLATAEVEDVVANLKHHGVRARANVTIATGSVAGDLTRLAERHGADLIVAGAYGHSRLQEWVFGGVTDELIHNPGCFVLMSH